MSSILANGIRWFIGILLLPGAYVLSRTAYDLMCLGQPASDAMLPPSMTAICIGFCLWLIVFFFLPRPVRAYILAHELSHALWGALTGARVRAIRVSRQTGSVTLSHTNVLTVLAPYFFPLYTIAAIALFYVAGLFIDTRPFRLAWLGLVGFTWAFHLSFTLLSLFQHQSDVQRYGRLFSYTIIYALNVLGVCLWIVLISRAGLEDLAGHAANHGHEAATRLWSWGRSAAAAVHEQTRARQ